MLGSIRELNLMNIANNLNRIGKIRSPLMRMKILLNITSLRFYKRPYPKTNNNNLKPRM
jgi:hypothetical protein